MWAGTSILSEPPWRELKALQGRGRVRDTQIAGSHNSRLVHSRMSRDGQGLDNIRLPIANDFASPCCPREYQYQPKALTHIEHVPLILVNYTFDTCAVYINVCTVYTKTRVDNVTVECCCLPQAITFHASAEVL